MNKKIRVLIIEDEELARVLLKKFIENNNEYEVIGECTNGFEGAMAIKEKKPDLVLLDIQMPKLNGFEMLEFIENPPAIIFTTAFDNFAIKAFEFGAVDYLLKPFSKKRFISALEKSRIIINKKLESNNSMNNLLEYVREKQEIIKRIAVKTRNNIEIIHTNNIERIEAQDDYVFIYTIDGKRFLKSGTMSYLEKHLDPTEFIRIHRSNIIRIDRISKIELYEKDQHLIFLKGGDKVKASRNGYKALKKVLYTN